MNPAPSVIVFTVLSGMGFGYLAMLGFGLVPVAGWAAFFGWGLGYGLAVAGLVASTFHLGNPQRALLAFTQWRTSWLSREGWAAVLTLVLLAPQALSDWLVLDWWRGFGCLGAVMCFVTVGCTSMIYAQIKAVPRWNHWIVPVQFLWAALTGGLVLAGAGLVPAAASALLAALLVLGWRIGDGRFAAVGATLGSATGLGAIGSVAVFEQPHTGGNYLLREMIYVVGRKHAERLRKIGLLAVGFVPAAALLFLPPLLAVPVAALSHLAGMAAARWLFFAEAEHVVGLYYGQR
ncbi:dimethyl sulfoxide reductase anchor subunit family protein [Paragemmobacter straminiformis]|uniref:Dimethyl sulfoxide reductase anchor subunit n=1 Tax=Paragemmobacter straminiformis TaxID=2045119 RepID=A0A842IE09_9RHOB|nr:DmsC/YnfH family molybdoenzyme membrane anchor subunit [Gemmobacter straminiformis]MBC2837244.1 dimethyl sulfoxide reductase anchor subunit [Gemmobacter straminiformis]